MYKHRTSTIITEQSIIATKVYLISNHHYGKQAARPGWLSHQTARRDGGLCRVQRSVEKAICNPPSDRRNDNTSSDVKPIAREGHVMYYYILVVILLHIICDILKAFVLCFCITSILTRHFYRTTINLETIIGSASTW